jgi:CarD family transcriptional regulator
MFKVNDAVVYAAYGVCEVKAIEKRDLTGEEVEYYVLQPVGDTKNKFYVPTDRGTLREKMRKVLSREDTDMLISSMSGEKDIWIDDDIRRKEEYRRIIDKGERHELVRLVRTLYLRRKALAAKGKKLHANDERFLSTAENLLSEEFAFVLGIPREEVVPYIKAHI